MITISKLQRINPQKIGKSIYSVQPGLQNNRLYSENVKKEPQPAPEMEKAVDLNVATPAKAVETDAETDKAFSSDVQVATKHRSKKYWLYVVGFGVFLCVTSSVFYYVAVTNAENVIESFWVPEEQFNMLSTEEVLNRLGHLNQFLEFNPIREYMFAQQWPLMMCIQSLKHRDALVRENALHILTKMADYDNFRPVIGKKVNFQAIFKEINSREGFEKDDISFHTFLSQYMDLKNVQKHALTHSNGAYFEKLVAMINSTEAEQRGLAILSLAKLAENPEGNLAIANSGVFSLVHNMFDPYDPVMTLANDGTAFKFKVREQACSLLNSIFHGPNQESAVKGLSPKRISELPATLARFDRESTKAYLYGQLMTMTVVSAIAVAVPWGYIRYILANRWARVPFSSRELLHGLTKGSSRSVVGAFFFILGYQGWRFGSDQYLASHPASHPLQASVQSLTLMVLYSGFLLTRAYFPFSFVPAALALATSNWPQRMWDINRESDFLSMINESDATKLQDEAKGRS